MIRNWILVLFLFFGLESNLFSQRYFTRIYTEADGLPSNMVFDITQDTSGLLWFATRYGISSYDGVNWTNYNPPANRISPSFAFIMTDERGKIWAVPLQSEPTAFWFSGEEWHKFDCKTGKTHPVIISAFDVFYQDDTPILALGTQKDGVFISRNKQWVHYGEKEGLISNKIRSIVVLGDQIFIGTKMGLSVLRGGHVSNELNTLLPTGSQEVLALALARNSETAGNQKIYLMGKGWLGTLSDSAFSMITEGFDLAKYKVTSNSFIYPDENNGLFFGNPYDLYYLAPYSADSFERMDRDNGLISDGATSVLIDHEKNIWLTSFRGVNKIPSFRFSSFTAIEGLFDNEVASALEYAPGFYIFGHLGGVTFFDGKNFETMNFNPSGEKPDYEIRIQDLDYDQKGNIWLSGSKLGIARIDKQKRVKWYRKSRGIEDNMVSVVVMPDRKIYAASHKQVFELSSEDKFIPVSAPKIRNSQIRKLFAEDDTTLYVATINSGILAKRDRESTLIQSPANLNGNNVFAFLTDSRERRWVGTNDGLYIITEGELVKYDSNGLTINRPIYLILEDHLGNIWFGTDNGVFRWNGKKLDQFTKVEGLLGQDINRDAGFMDHQNHIWFGTNSDLTGLGIP